MFHAFLLARGSVLAVFLGLWVHHPVSVFIFMCPPCVCVAVSKFPLHIRTLAILD